MTTLNELKKHLKKGKVYRRNELAEWSKSVDRHLDELLKEGVLEKRQLELKNVSIQVKKDELKPNKMEENEKNIVPIQENDLSVILLDTIQKVQKDKTYINQANAICNVVSQMINIKKLELQLARNVR